MTSITSVIIEGVIPFIAISGTALWIARTYSTSVSDYASELNDLLENLFTDHGLPALTDDHSGNPTLKLFRELGRIARLPKLFDLEIQIMLIIAILGSIAWVFSYLINFIHTIFPERTAPLYNTPLGINAPEGLAIMTGFSVFFAIIPLSHIYRHFGYSGDKELPEFDF